MEIFIVSFVLFLVSIGALAVAQWVRKAPLPVGCTPGTGECCQVTGGTCHGVPGDSQSLELVRRI